MKDEYEKRTYSFNETECNWDMEYFEKMDRTYTFLDED